VSVYECVCVCERERVCVCVSVSVCVCVRERETTTTTAAQVTAQPYTVTWRENVWIERGGECVRDCVDTERETVRPPRSPLNLLLLLYYYVE